MSNWTNQYTSTAPAGRLSITPALLDDVPFIVMGPDHMTHRRTREAFEAAGARLRPKVFTHLFRNKLSFVKEGMGVSLLDGLARAFDKEAGLIFRPFRPAIYLDMMVVTSTVRPLSALGKEFLELLLNELADYSIAPPGAAASDDCVQAASGRSATEGGINGA